MKSRKIFGIKPIYVNIKKLNNFSNQPKYEK